MLQEQNKSFSFPSHNPSPDVKQRRDRAKTRLQREAQDQHRRASSSRRLQIYPKTQSIGKLHRNLVSPFPLVASNAWASAWLKKSSDQGSDPASGTAGRDAGYVPLCLDFQVGESSGPSCSSPSLIIPIVIISLNSRRLEGKKFSFINSQGARNAKAAREAAAGDEARADCGGSCPLPRLQTRGAKRVHLNSSSPSPAG